MNEIPAWHKKAHRMIEAEAFRCYHEENTGKYLNKVKAGTKKSKPYTLPEWVKDLTVAIGKDDEETAKRIMMWNFMRDY